MLEIKRISAFSNISISSIWPTDSKIIQVITDQDHNITYVEYILPEDVPNYIIEQTGKCGKVENYVENSKSEAQKELETALDTVLDNDPLKKYSGYRLREIFDCGDFEWVDWVLKYMHNKFIRDKVELIRKSGYGK